LTTDTYSYSNDHDDDDDDDQDGPEAHMRRDFKRPTSPMELQRKLDFQCSPILPKDVEFYPKPTMPTMPTTTTTTTLHDYSSFRFSQDESSMDDSTGSTYPKTLQPLAAFETEKIHHSSNNHKEPKCPLTPVKTPTFTRNKVQLQTVKKPLLRSNSLIVTKVLATCASDVPDGRSSLENSMLDEKSACPDTDDESFETAIQDISSHSSMSSYIKDKTSQPTADNNDISFTTSFENLGDLGSGAFADVYKVRFKGDGQLYAVKRNRRQFRGRRDRDLAMTEALVMQSLQASARTIYSDYVLFFYRAWQEEGYFYCQTELCCRDTCRELLLRIARKEQYLPNTSLWKICHDVAAGLVHIHSHGIVHHDLKPSNVFLVPHVRLGATCKIGDFGNAGAIGTAQDGHEGDTKYMPPELLSSCVKHPSADIFSLGLSVYELAANLEVPLEGPRWHELRSGTHTPTLPPLRHEEDLTELIHATMRPDPAQRPTAEQIVLKPGVQQAGNRCDEFLRDFIRGVEQEELNNQELAPIATPRNSHKQLRLPDAGMLSTKRGRNNLRQNFS
jgi:serine/threonine protein kinase